MKTILLGIVLCCSLTVSLAQITPAEAGYLQFLREEEKVAHNVYEVLYAIWNEPSFLEIMSEEAEHMEVLKHLLKQKDIPDPLEGIETDNGIFTRPALKKMFEDLTAQGARSVTEAYKVAAIFEETDIRDLTNRFNATQDPDVREVYDELIHASEHHLRTCVQNLKRLGYAYPPTVLPREDYERIIKRRWDGA